jgi:PIN domain nuclease of toxin-antitoxin system
MRAKFLLDSHTVLWTLYEPHLLPPAVRILVEDSLNELLISDLSIWELVDKAAKYRLPVAGFSPDRIVERIMGLGSTILRIELDDIVASVKLPSHHGDPHDRLIIAQARRTGATLLSKDGKFKQYDVPLLWA